MSVKITDREIRKIVKSAVKQGCEVKASRRSSHIQIIVPGKGIVTVSSSPSDERAYKNIRADLRRNGIVV